MPRKRKDKLNIDTIGIEQVYKLGQEAGDLQTKILIYILFITGSRITEALKICKKNIVWAVPKQPNIVLFKNLIVLKRKEHTTRSVPIIKDDDIYKERMLKDIKAYWDMIPDETLKLFPRLTNKTADYRISKLTITTTAYKGKGKDAVTFFNYKTNLYAHFLRHSGITWLINKYPKLDVLKTTKLIGWADTRQATRYYSATWTDLLNAMD